MPEAASSVQTPDEILVKRVRERDSAAREELFEVIEPMPTASRSGYWVMNRMRRCGPGITDQGIFRNRGIRRPKRVSVLVLAYRRQYGTRLGTTVKRKTNSDVRG